MNAANKIGVSLLGLFVFAFYTFITTSVSYHNGYKSGIDYGRGLIHKEAYALGLGTYEVENDTVEFQWKTSLPEKQ